jgi:murein L,D-transpeptidase YcbB/YkuD
MNKINTLILICFAVALSNCREAAKNRVNADKPVRNTSINKSNSYSSLFTDSSTVESFINEQKLNDTIAHDMRVFYNARNFQFAWFSGDGLTEQTFAFRSLYDYSNNDKKKPLDFKLDNLMLNDSLKSLRASPNITKTELSFTWRFIQYLWNNYPNKSVRNNLLVKFVPAQKQELMERADRVINDDRIAANAGYKSLKKELEKYVAIAKHGGWPYIPEKKKTYKNGKSDPVITIIKKRLQTTGEFAEKDTSPVFTPEFENTIKKVQREYGILADGIIRPSLVDELNKSAAFRIQQIMINMERMRWQPEDPNGRMIQVNIPEFMMHVWDKKTKAFDMEVIVGKQGNSTIMFSGDLDQIVFAPYWNVPESIVREEMLTTLEENPDYLYEHNMEMTDTVDGVPVIRQLPGEENELGKVKFLFPNSFNIYFHDTPHKELFKKQQRAYSHGCIRLADAEKLANYLLKDDGEWTPEKIKKAMNAEEEKYVKLKEPIPVLINYYTAWVDENGELQFRKDIYGHDKKTARKLFRDESALASNTE